jgi:phosphoglycerol transferase MdoB-like AlkP superfamily enzyme
MNFLFAFRPIIQLLKRISMVFIIYTFCRILFFIANYSYFEGANLGHFISGLRFDMIAISMFFAPFILLQVLPLPVHHKNWHKLTLNIFFLLALGVSVIINLIDVAYFEYTFKRSTADIFGMLGNGGEFLTLLPSYLKDFWYVFVFAILLIVLGVLINKKISKNKIEALGYTWKTVVIQSVVFLLVVGFTVIGIRGRFQRKVITLVSAGEYARTKFIPLVLNTPFTILRTLLSEKLERKEFFTQTQLDSIYSPLEISKAHLKFEGKNVVFIVLESFAREFVGFTNNGKGYTPFLDSLFEQSLVFDNAYANASRSIESLPCILAGLPQLMDKTFVLSNYAANPVDGLPAILKSKGYNTSFYHGGDNGTMAFDAFVGTIGVDKYYGKNEYPNIEQDHDGRWGISDEPYLQYFEKELDQKAQPFFSTVFTLSSHHPYNIPEKYKDKFPKGVLPQHESVGYTDHSLKLFFKEAEKSPWFENTLFVITSDHSTKTSPGFYRTILGRFAIPIAIYDPKGDVKGRYSEPFQQIDLESTVLSLLGIEAQNISFGQSAFSDKPRYVINYAGQKYQLFYKDHILMFIGSKSTAFYDLKNDSLQKNNIITSLDSNQLKIQLESENLLKAIVQQYNNRLLDNELSPNKLLNGKL